MHRNGGAIPYSRACMEAVVQHASVPSGDPGTVAELRTRRSVSCCSPRRRTSSKPLNTNVVWRSPRGITGAGHSDGGREGSLLACGAAG